MNTFQKLLQWVKSIPPQPSKVSQEMNSSLASLKATLNTVPTEAKIRNCTFAFRCKENFYEMMATRDDGTVRFCVNCMQEVFLCKTNEELSEHIRSNHCIAILQKIRGRETMLLGLPIVRKKTA
jgi:hypothetical protein